MASLLKSGIMFCAALLFLSEPLLAGNWPDVPCPPTASTTARSVLLQIQDLANSASTPTADTYKCGMRALEAIYQYNGVDLDPCASSTQSCQKVEAAHAAAVQGNWAACAAELDHGE